MKLFNKIFLALVFFFLGSLPQNSFGMEVDDCGKIIILAGISCSGKTTIGKLLIKKFPNSVYVSQDEITDEEIKKYEKDYGDNNSRWDTEQILAIQKAKELAADCKTVICDLIPLNSQDEPVLNDSEDLTSIYPTFKVLIFTPFNQLLQHVEKRNKEAKADDAKSDDHRDPYYVTKQFAETFKPADVKTSPTKKIPVNIKSDEFKQKCIAFSPPNSPILQDRLLGAVQRNLFPDEKKKQIDSLTTIESYDFIFKNNDFTKKGAPDIDVLVFAIEKWIKKLQDSKDQ